MKRRLDGGSRELGHLILGSLQSAFPGVKFLLAPCEPAAFRLSWPQDAPDAPSEADISVFLRKRWGGDITFHLGSADGQATGGRMAGAVGTVAQEPAVSGQPSSAPPRRTAPASAPATVESVMAEAERLLAEENTPDHPCKGCGKLVPPWAEYCSPCADVVWARIFRERERGPQRASVPVN